MASVSSTKRLIDRLEASGWDRKATPALDDDTILEHYLEWVGDLGLELYEAQEEAVLELMAGRHVILNTPTGSGKSMVALAMMFRALARGEHAYYTSPIKALVSEKFFDMCRAFGPENVGMLTGDASVNPEAPLICCTAEVLANIALRDGAWAQVEAVVMDEFHYYGDRDRGMAWQVPLLTLPQSTFLLMSATLGDMRRFEQGLHDFTGREVALVTSAQRPVPLVFEYREVPLQETLVDLVEQDRAPVYVVNFTQRAAAEMAQNLTSVKLIEREQRQQINAELGDFRFDSSYGKDIQRFVKAGIGLHHAGLLPKYRRLVERLSQKGLLKVICGTDTLGVGVNVPIRTVLFTQLCKYDGEGTKILTVRDFKQIAGRAGRKGYDDKGWVVCQAPEHVIENKRLEAKARAGKQKKFVRRKPPERGYVPWDDGVFRRLNDSPPEELVSRFRVDHGLMLNLLQRQHREYRRGGGYRDLMELLNNSHERVGRASRLRRSAAQLFRALRGAGIVELKPRATKKGQEVAVSGDLQNDFSLFHTLSLYLLDALYLLDPGDEDYALNVLSLVESVLEHPRAILAQQERKLKDELVAEMKAAGLEYEERMEKLEKVSYPKPHAEFIYRTFGEFSAAHPWVGQENIRPKSIVRDMYERYMTFNEYVREFGLQRMEGLLLRYVHQAYKTLDQTVPEGYKSDAVIEIQGWLRATLEQVDSSLVQEWEALMSPPEDLQDAFADARPPEIDISADRKTFMARLRAEMHHLLRGLSRQNWEEAAAGVRVSSDAHTGDWSAEGLEAALLPFFEEYERLVFDHRARMPDKTVIRELGDHRWQVRQVMLDPREDNMWMIEAEVDLSQDKAPEGPLLQLVRIGT